MIVEPKRTSFQRFNQLQSRNKKTFFRTREQSIQIVQQYLDLTERYRDGLQPNQIAQCFVQAAWLYMTEDMIKCEENYEVAKLLLVKSIKVTNLNNYTKGANILLQLIACPELYQFQIDNNEILKDTLAEGLNTWLQSSISNQQQCTLRNTIKLACNYLKIATNQMPNNLIKAERQWVYYVLEPLKRFSNQKRKPYLTENCLALRIGRQFYFHQNEKRIEKDKNCLSGEYISLHYFLFGYTLQYFMGKENDEEILKQYLKSIKVDSNQGAQNIQVLENGKYSAYFHIQKLIEGNPKLSEWAGVQKLKRQKKQLLKKGDCAYLCEVERYLGNQIQFSGLQLCKPINLHGGQWDNKVQNFEKALKLIKKAIQFNENKQYEVQKCQRQKLSIFRLHYYKSLIYFNKHEIDSEISESKRLQQALQSCIDSLQACIYMEKEEKVPFSIVTHGLNLLYLFQCESSPSAKSESSPSAKYESSPSAQYESSPSAKYESSPSTKTTEFAAGLKQLLNHAGSFLRIEVSLSDLKTIYSLKRPFNKETMSSTLTNIIHLMNDKNNPMKSQYKIYNQILIEEKLKNYTKDVLLLNNLFEVETKDSEDEKHDKCNRYKLYVSFLKACWTSYEAAELIAKKSFQSDFLTGDRPYQVFYKRFLYFQKISQNTKSVKAKAEKYSESLINLSSNVHELHAIIRLILLQKIELQIVKNNHFTNICDILPHQGEEISDYFELIARKSPSDESGIKISTSLVMEMNELQQFGFYLGQKLMHALILQNMEAKDPISSVELRKLVQKHMKLSIDTPLECRCQLM